MPSPSRGVVFLKKYTAASSWFFGTAAENLKSEGFVKSVVSNKERFLPLDQRVCTKTCFKALEKKEKPIFLKELKEVWGGNGLLRIPTQFSSSNTLLIDNEPYKALLNPPHSAIFLNEYKADDVDDSGLKGWSELRLYLEKVAEAEDVPEFVEGNPFGKPAISPQHPHWDFYSKMTSLKFSSPFLT